MVVDAWVHQENMRRYREMLEGQGDPKIRAMLERLLEAEQEKLDGSEPDGEETRRKIKRYRDKAEELRTIADQTETGEVRIQFRRAADNYDAMADGIERAAGDPPASTGTAR